MEHTTPASLQAPTRKSYVTPAAWTTLVFVLGACGAALFIGPGAALWGGLCALLFPVAYFRWRADEARRAKATSAELQQEWDDNQW